MERQFFWSEISFHNVLEAFDVQIHAFFLQHAKQDENVQWKCTLFLTPPNHVSLSVLWYTKPWVIPLQFIAG